MSPKRVIPRELATSDVDEALDHYLREGGEQVALGCIDALESAYGHIARHPAARSPRYAQELDLAALRAWPLKRYPHQVFYVERHDHIDVWRVVHGERDIPAWLRQPADESGHASSDTAKRRY